MSHSKPVPKLVQTPQVKLLRNLFRIEFGKIAKFYRYGVSIEMHKPNLPKRVLSTDEKHDQAISHKLLDAFMASKQVKYAYDGAGLLVTTKAIDEEEVRLNADQLASWKVNELASYANNVGGEVHLSLSYAPEDYELDVKRDYAKESFRQCVELITNQHAISSGSYVKKGGLLVATNKFEDKQWYLVFDVVHKSVHLVQKHKSDKTIEPETAIELEPSQAMMIAPLPMPELFIKMMGSKSIQLKANERITGDKLTTCTNLAKKMSVIMVEYEDRGDDVIRPVLKNGKLVFGSNPKTINSLDNRVQFTPEYQQKYPNLKYPEWPAAECGYRNNKNPIPLEYLCVKPYQRLTVIKMEQLMESSSRVTAPAPSIRYSEIKKHFVGLALTADKNAVMKSFGMDIIETPDKLVTVSGERLSAPSVYYGGKSVDVNAKDHSWEDIKLKFDRAAVIDHLVIGMILKSMNQREEMDSFIENLVFEAGKAGVVIKKQVTVLKNREMEVRDFVESLFDGLSAKSNPYVMLLEGRRGQQSEAHCILKGMEMKYDVITQNVTVNIATNAVKQVQTMRNILNKFNTKAGGRNYYCIPPSDVFKSTWLDRTLMVGVDVGHPKTSCRGGSTPSVPAFTANIGKTPFEFCGDFALATAKQERIESDVVIRWARFIIKQWLASGRQAPTTIFYIRDGVDDGQEDKVLDESKAFASACMDAVKAIAGGERREIKLVVIVARKRNNVRLFALDSNNQLKNPLPGTIIEEGVAAYGKQEFYLYAPNPRIGTAQFLRCTVLLKEITAPDPMLKAVMHSLCFLHQLDKSPTSLAIPLLLADEMATRGGTIWSYFNRFQNLQKTDNNTWAELTEQICYISNCKRLLTRRTV